MPRALVSRGIIDAELPDVLFLVAGYGPALSALLITALVSGGAGLRRLGARLCLWRVHARWYAVALFLPAAQAFIALGLHLLFGGELQRPSEPPTLQVGSPGTPLWIQALLLALMFTLGFDGLGEELGWRGFALPRLLKRYRALSASVVMGAMWALWHLPYALTMDSAMANKPFYAHLPQMFAASILFTWIFNNTRGSILLAILFHASGNLTANVLPVIFPGVYGSGVWGEIVPWIVVGLVVAIYGPAHLSRTRTRPPKPLSLEGRG